MTANVLPLAVSGGLEKTDFRLITKINKMQETNNTTQTTPLQQTAVSSSALRVLNYVKKHNCRVRMRWYCGIQVHRVWKDNRELSYPYINEDIWCEISKFFKQDGDYQHTHFYDLHCC